MQHQRVIESSHCQSNIGDEETFKLVKELRSYSQKRIQGEDEF